MSNKDRVQRQNRDPFYYRYRDHFVGIFVLIPIIAIPIMVINLFVSSDLFNERFSLHLHLKHPARIEPANSVTIMEKKVGYVKSVSLNQEGFLDVEMLIEEEYRSLIRKGSVGLVKQEQTIVGDWMVDITIGDSSMAVVEDGDTISTGEFIRIENMIQRLTKMSISASEILNRIAYGDGTISKLLSDDELSEELLKLLDKSITLFAGLDNTLSDVTPLIKAGERAIHSLDSMGSSGVSMTKELVKFADNANILVDSLQVVFSKYDTLAVKTSEIPPVMEKSFEELSETLSELELILEGLQRHWFLKRSIKRAKEEKE